MKKALTLLCLLILFKCQAQDSLSQAFARSYALEKVELYLQSVNALKEMYSEKSYEMNLRIGYLYYLAGKQDESVKYYTRAHDLKPNSMQAKLGLIYPYSALKKWDIVKKLYEDLLKIDPTSSYVSYKLGLIHYERKNFEEALRLFEVVYTLYPFDYGGLLMMGWANYQLGNKAQARLFFSKTLLIAPGDKSALEGLSMAK